MLRVPKAGDRVFKFGYYLLVPSVLTGSLTWHNKKGTQVCP